MDMSQYMLGPNSCSFCRILGKECLTLRNLEQDGV